MELGAMAASFAAMQTYENEQPSSATPKRRWLGGVFRLRAKRGSRYFFAATFGATHLFVAAAL